MKLNNNKEWLEKMVKKDNTVSTSVLPSCLPKIGTSDFVKRQTSESEFTHFEGSWEELETICSYLFSMGKFFPGYRDGVVRILIPQDICEKFRTYTDFPMFEGMSLSAEYRKVKGREHEPAKIVVRINELKQRCNFVEVIVYRADVLNEDGDRSTEADWEIVSINGRLKENVPPMDALTIVRNWKHLPGGTEMKDRTAEEVLEMLCESIMYQNKLSKG
jgi:hypothetical protein